MRINFLPADYRGYGRSTGNPALTAMLKYSHTIPIMPRVYFKYDRKLPTQLYHLRQGKPRYFLPQGVGS
jgi:hypothetical protein